MKRSTGQADSVRGHTSKEMTLLLGRNSQQNRIMKAGLKMTLARDLETLGTVKCSQGENKRIFEKIPNRAMTPLCRFFKTLFLTVYSLRCRSTVLGG